MKSAGAPAGLEVSIESLAAGGEGVGHDSSGRVVFVTGDTLATTLREFVDESGRPVIEKPFLPSEVRRVVAELVNKGEVTPPG